MPTFIRRGLFGDTPDYKAQEAWEAKKLEREIERDRTEALIIEHTEKATNTKAIEVDGELKYIPLDEAKRLGLL